MRPTYLLFAVTLGLLAPVFALPSSANAQEGPASRALHSRHDAVLSLLRRPESESRTEAVTALLSELLDYSALAEAALGRHWDDRSASEQEQFRGLLQQLIERSYKANLSDSTNFRVRYDGEETEDGVTTVRTRARSRSNRRAPEVSIDYRMTADHKVVDVVTDGVSMVRNYRSQFARIIRRDGFEGVIGRMQSRLEEGSEI